MQKPSEKTSRMYLGTEEDIYNTVISEDHAFRKISTILDISIIVEPLRELYSNMGNNGIDIEKGFKTLLIQFWEDYSDREMEKAVRENIAVRWFCGFGFSEETPDHSYFGKLRKRIGTEQLSKQFNAVNEQLRKHGLFGDTFTFVDASSIISKTQLWDERDRAIKAGEETLNNAVVSKYAADKEAKWGAKGKNDIWFGYKRHTAVDMRHGLIQSVVTTPANILDYQIFDELNINNSMVFADKLYDVESVYEILQKNNCASGIIQKNNRKNRNKDLNRFRSQLRSPFEGTYAHIPKRTRYRGKKKVEFQVLMQSIVHNIKKAITVLQHSSAPPIGT